MYTLELYKSDKRTAAGERLESTTDVSPFLQIEQIIILNFYILGSER